MQTSDNNTKIGKIKENEQLIYPVTHSEAVIYRFKTNEEIGGNGTNDDAISLKEKLLEVDNLITELQQTIGDLQQVLGMCDNTAEPTVENYFSYLENFLGTEWGWLSDNTLSQLIYDTIGQSISLNSFFQSGSGNPEIPTMSLIVQCLDELVNAFGLYSGQPEFTTPTGGTASSIVDMIDSLSQAIGSMNYLSSQTGYSDIATYLENVIGDITQIHEIDGGYPSSLVDAVNTLIDKVNTLESQTNQQW